MSSENKNTPIWDTAVRAESLSWSIVRQIRDALYAGKLKPGDFLGSEITLAQQFGVSRMAARDALRSLVAVGVVEIRMGSRGGAWVATGNLERLEDAFTIQLHLIGLTPEELLEAQSSICVVAAEIAANRASTNLTQRLSDAMRITAQSVDDPEVFTSASLKFHECIVEATENRVLIAQFRALESVLRPLLAANTTSITTKKVIKSNEELLKAITARDSQMAGQLMRERVAAIRTTILGKTKIAIEG